MTKKQAAYTAFLSLILMALLAFFSYGYVHTTLITGDASSTFENIQGNLFTANIISWSLIVLLDLVVTYSFYVYLKDTSKTLAAIGAGLRLVYTLFLGTAVTSLIAARGSEAMVLSKLNTFDNIWSLGLIIFGLHLVVIGINTLKMTTPRYLSILILLAGLSYILIHSLMAFNVSVDTLEMVLGLPMTAGELGFGIWLFIQGKKIKST